MRLQATYRGTGNFTVGSVYQLNVEQGFFGSRVKIYPHRRISKRGKAGETVIYDDIAEFVQEWAHIVDKTDEERAAIEELHASIKDSGAWLNEPVGKKN